MGREAGGLNGLFIVDRKRVADVSDRGEGWGGESEAGGNLCLEMPGMRSGSNLVMEGKRAKK